MLPRNAQHTSRVVLKNAFNHKGENAKSRDRKQIGWKCAPICFGRSPLSQENHEGHGGSGGAWAGEARFLVLRILLLQIAGNTTVGFLARGW